MTSKLDISIKWTKWKSGFSKLKISEKKSEIEIAQEGKKFWNPQISAFFIFALEDFEKLNG